MLFGFLQDGWPYHIYVVHIIAKPRAWCMRQALSELNAIGQPSPRDETRKTLSRDRGDGAMGKPRDEHPAVVFLWMGERVMVLCTYIPRIHIYIYIYIYVYIYIYIDVCVCMFVRFLSLPSCPWWHKYFWPWCSGISLLYSGLLQDGTGPPPRKAAALLVEAADNGHWAAMERYVYHHVCCRVWKISPGHAREVVHHFRVQKLTCMWVLQ